MKHLHPLLRPLAILLLLMTAAPHIHAIDADDYYQDPVPADPTKYQDGDFYFQIMDLDKKLVQTTYLDSNNNEYVTGEVTIPEFATINGEQYTVYRIGRGTFEKNSKLTKLTIPATVTQVGMEFITSCYGLKEVIIEDSPDALDLGLQGFDSGAIFWKSSVEYVYMGRNLNFDCGCQGESCGASPFYHCPNLRKFVMSDFVTRVDDYLLNKCAHLEELRLSPNIQFIGWMSFYNCESLTSFSVPPSVQYIDGIAFKGCDGLKEFIIEDGDTPLRIEPSNEGPHFKKAQNLERVVIGRPLTYSQFWLPPFAMHVALREVEFRHTAGTGMTSDLFKGCSKLERVTLNDSFTSLGDSMFDGCTSLTQLEIPSTVTTIGDATFCNSVLAEATIPEGVTQMGDYVFENSRLTAISLPSTLTHIGSSAFLNATALRHISCAAATPPECLDGAGFDYRIYERALLSVPQEALEAYAAAEPWNLFMNVNEDKGLIVAVDGITYHIDSADAVSVTSPYDPADYNRDLVIPATVQINGVTYGVTAVAPYALNESTAANLSLPAGIRSLGDNALKNCRSLESLTVGAAEPPTVGKNALYKVPVTTCIFYVPKGSASAYRKDADWKAFKKIQEFEVAEESGVESIVALPGEAAVYTIDGRRVPLSADALPAGLYVIDGRKVIVR